MELFEVKALTHKGHVRMYTYASSHKQAVNNVRYRAQCPLLDIEVRISESKHPSEILASFPGKEPLLAFAKAHCTKTVVTFVEDYINWKRKEDAM